MDPALLKVIEQAPWVGLILWIWQKTAEERRETRAWFERQQAEITKVIEANTQALQTNTLTLGEANAARLACPAGGGALDERGHPYRRRHSNGEGEGGIG